MKSVKALKHTPVKLAIIGGGAAGLFAAATAAKHQLPTLILERKARLGSKLLMTANGRCNFTRDLSAEEFLAEIGNCAPFVAQAIREYPPRQLIASFKAHGIRLRRMSDGRIFPADNKAATIVHMFGDFLRNSGVPILSNCPVTGIQPLKNGFLVATASFTLWAEKVLLATGGVSFPKTGSVGDGQLFAHHLGHCLVPYQAGLTGLETNEKRVTSRAGNRYEASRAQVLSPTGKPLFDYHGEIDCETFGLSGAAIYNCQRFLAHAKCTHYTLETWFDQEHLLFHDLKPRPVKEAIVTIGGVSCAEVDPATMQSRLCPGLYFAGEILDIDGPTGGYNLTLAFATARKAVKAIIQNA